MRSKLLLLLFFISFVNSIYSQKWLEDTCKLNGNVNIINYISESELISKHPVFHKETQEYNRLGYLIRESRSSSLFGQNFNGYYRLYNEYGNQCEREYFIQDGDTAAITDFFFSNQGHIVKSTLYVWGKYTNTINYFYENNLMVRQFGLESSSDTILKIFDYDKNNRMIFQFHTIGRLENFTFWQYNKIGLLRKEEYVENNWAPRITIYKNVSGETDSIVRKNYDKKPYNRDNYILKYHYNRNGQLIKKVKKDAKGRMIYKSEFKYNVNGNIIEEIKGYGLKSKKKWITTFEYVYDDRGNWIEKVTKISGEVDQKETREITYF